MFSSKFLWAGLTALLLTAPVWAAIDLPPLDEPVVDLARLIPRKTQDLLDRALTNLVRQGGPQVAVLTLPSLEGQTIEQVAINVFDKWTLGDKARDDGVLLIVALKERRIRIEVGQGLEGDLPDAWAKRIVDESMMPMFRAGDPGGGILVGVFEILQRIAPNEAASKLLQGEGELTPAHGPLKGTAIPMAVFILCWILIIGMSYFGGGHRMVGRRSYWGYGDGPGGWGSGGGFGGWGGGSGGYSGGGGSSSGGGASGGW